MINDGLSLKKKKITYFPVGQLNWKRFSIFHPFWIEKNKMRRKIKEGSRFGVGRGRERERSSSSSTNAT
jgi:hypothetical protein